MLKPREYVNVELGDEDGISYLRFSVSLYAFDIQRCMESFHSSSITAHALWWTFYNEDHLNEFAEFCERHDFIV